MSDLREREEKKETPISAHLKIVAQTYNSQWVPLSKHRNTQLLQFPLPNLLCFGRKSAAHVRTLFAFPMREP